METNAFFCPICNKNTRHIEIHLSEVSAVSGEGKFFQVGYTVAEKSLSRMNEFAGRHFWKCCECTSIYQRDNGGTIQTVIKHGSPNQRNHEQEKIFIPQNTINLLINNTTINNYYLEASQQCDYPWIHKQDGYVGTKLDRYTVILEGQMISSLEQKKGLANTLYKLNLGLGTRENIQWKLSQGRNKIEWANLTKDEAKEIFDKLSGSFLIDYVKVI